MKNTYLLIFCLAAILVIGLTTGCVQTTSKGCTAKKTQYKPKFEQTWLQDNPKRKNR